MPYNILLVDDDSEFREEFCDFLEDYEVIEASNGEEALDILRKPNEVDLVILDVMMPGKRGTDVLREIKAMSPDLKVIILTGYSSKDVAVKALKGRADEYIEKPPHPFRTKEIIDRLLESAGGGEEGIDGDMEGKIQRVKTFVERNYHKKVRLEDAAERVYLSPKYLSRVFREVTGKRFSDYRLEVKTEKAKEILAGTGKSVSQISDELGYLNTESFIRIFKKFTDLTPTAYRMSRRKK